MNAPTLSPAFVARALDLPPPPSGENATFSLITTDSRKVAPGCLFVAIPGDQFDGHQFVESALEKGAAAALIRKDFLTPALRERYGNSVQFLEVADTVDAYRRLAHAWRNTFNIPVFAVAGSVGKTTTKEILAAILRGRYRNIVSTQGSQNGFVGIPMTLLGLTRETEVAVIEVGIDEVGTMVHHIDLIRPTHAVLTAIGPEHLEKLIDVPTVAREEAIALSRTAERGGTVVVRMDDEWISPLAATLPATQQRTFALGERSVSADGATLEVSLPGTPAFSLEMPLRGRHNASNLLCAVTCAISLGLTPDEIKKGLATFQGAFGRSELKLLPRDTPVICDYYNANPSSVEAGLALLVEIAQGKKRKWAVLGDMLELGTHEESLHRGLAKKIVECGVNQVLLFGKRMEWLADELKSSGIPTAHYADQAKLAEGLARDFGAGDALLIKGSRGMKMEQAWKIAEPEILKKISGASA